MMFAPSDAQKRALQYYLGGDIANRKDADGNFIRTPGAVVNRNLMAMGLIELVPDAPRRTYRITEAGRLAVTRPLQAKGE